MNVSSADVLAWFPYEPRLHQDRAVSHAAMVTRENTVGLLSADCGVGKTIAVLSGYLATRAEEPDFKLIVLCRTHSQSKVFETELGVLHKSLPTLTATSMVSRMHVCPMREDMDKDSSSGFTRSCAKLIRTGRCSYYWNFYKKGKQDNRPQIRENAKKIVDDLLVSGVITRANAEEAADLEGICPYELLRWCGRRSRVIVGPYAYLFKGTVRDALLSSLGVGLEDVDILVDEAHNLPDHVLDSEAAQLSGDDLKWLRENSINVGRDSGIDWLGEAVEFLWETLMVKLDGIKQGGERQIDRWDVIPRFVNKRDVELLLERNRPLEDDDGTSPAETPLDRLVDFLYTGQRAIDSDDWHVTLEVRRSWREEVSLSDAYLKIRPFNAAGLVAPVIRGARSALLMSGTLRPTSHYARLLGAPSALVEDLSSPYPRGTRLVLLDKGITTKYTERGPNLWRTIALRINRALSVMPADKSALIAFPSYRVMEDILSYGVDCGFRGRIVETPGARIEDLKEAVDSGPHAIFAVYGGKFSEGIDLVKDGSSMIDIIIGVGIPFSPPTSYQRALQTWYDQRFGDGQGYYYSSVVPSIRRVAQLVGRLRRAPEDWGVVVLLDKRFLRYLSTFGDDMVSDVWPFTEEDEMAMAIQQFIKLREIEVSGLV
ncbi:MAG: ATP-dependent DNA helicase [Candidatus Thorarchaeota archaeon]